MFQLETPLRRLYCSAFLTVALGVLSGPATAAPIALFDVDVSITAIFGTATGTATAQLDDVGSLSFSGTATSTGGITVSSDASVIGTLVGNTLTVPMGGGASSISVDLISCTAAPQFCSIAAGVLPVTAPLTGLVPNPIVFDLGIGNQTVLMFSGGVTGINLDGTITLTTTQLIPEPSLWALVAITGAGLAIARRRL